MIIKSMTRKSNSFSQLYDYLMRDKSNFSFTRNTYSNALNKKKLIKEFLNNYKFLKDSRGKVSLYHEILSLENNLLSKERQKEILLDLADKYLLTRANNHLSFGVVHEDKEHIHLHLMISSNEIDGLKRIRLSKKEFSTIQKNLESYKNEKYSELYKSSFYQNKKDLSKEKQKEQEIKTKRNAQTLKDKIKDDLKQTFKTASSRTFLNNHLENLGYSLYIRGETIGVIYENKKYRLKTLGLENEYKAMFQNIEQRQERELRRQKNKEDKSYTNQQVRSRWKDRLNQITKRKR